MAHDEERLGGVTPQGVTPREELPEDITRWLQNLPDESPEALGSLFSALYGDLKRQAHAALRSAPYPETLDTTGLVNEAFLRLAGAGPVEVRDRRHFLSIAAKTMRWVLMDTARARKSQRRGGDLQRVTLDEAQIMSEDRATELLALDAALERLGNLDTRLVELVEYRFFGGMSIEETAAVLELSPRTVNRHWGRAKAFLSSQMAVIPPTANL